MEVTSVEIGVKRTDDGGCNDFRREIGVEKSFKKRESIMVVF